MFVDNDQTPPKLRNIEKLTTSRRMRQKIPTANMNIQQAYFGHVPDVTDDVISVKNSHGTEIEGKYNTLSCVPPSTVSSLLGRS